MKKFFIHLGFLFIIAGISVICVENVSATINNYYADIDRSKEITAEVEKSYKDFNDGALDVKESVIGVSKTFDVYFEEFPKVKDEIVEKIHVVESKINNLNEVSLNLIDKCEYDLNNLAMNNKCKSFKLNYVRMIESYEEMVSEYGKVIESYNKYALEHEKEVYELYKGEIDYTVYDTLAS